MTIKKPLLIAVLASALSALLVAFPPRVQAEELAAVRFSDLSVISLEKMLDEALMGDVIIIGEYHGLESHHRTQLKLIRMIRERTPNIAIGMEMFSYLDGHELDRWTGGQTGEDELLELYNRRWNYPYKQYRGIFTYARERGIPMVGLNVPSEIPKKVRENGFSSLTPEELSILPSGITCNVTEGYRDFMRSILGSHGNMESSFENFCEAQMLWDQTMARMASNYLKSNPGSKIIVLTGMMHAWKPAIPYQLQNMGNHRASVILPDLPDVPRDGLSKGLVDYLVVLK